MSKKRPGSPEQEDELFDQMMYEGGDYNEEEMLHTFEHVTLASVEHMKVAYELAKLMRRASPNASPDDILKYFRQASETVLDCTPLKALFEKV